jgi:hypothetical protein
MASSSGRSRAPAAILAFFLALSLTGCGGGSGGEPAQAGWLKADPASFTGHGVYWNPSEPGTGMFFESQGGTAVATFYAYEADGRAVWYSAIGPFVDNGGAGKYLFTGDLLRFSGGQSPGSTFVKTPRSAALGAVRIAFDGEKAQVSVPGRSYAVEKFYKAESSKPASGKQPETGIYWNPGQSGRGYTIEVNSDVATVVSYHYTPDGQPTWYLSTMPLPAGSAGKNVAGDLMTYTGGQTLGGAYKAPKASMEGAFIVNFDDACNGMLSSTGLVKRFGFGSLPAGRECRSPQSAGQAMWPMGNPVDGAQQYDYVVGGYTRDATLGLLVSNAARGYRHQAYSMYIRSSSETYEAELLPHPLTQPEALAQLRAMAAKGFRWHGAVGEVAGGDGQAYLKGSSGKTYSYNVEPTPASGAAADYLARANAQGAQGFRHVGSIYSQGGQFLVFEKLDSNDSRFVYESRSPPVRELDFIALLDDQGSRGFRFVARRFRSTGTGQVNDFAIFERDTTQDAAFTYSTLHVLETAFAVFSQVNGEGARGAILYGSYVWEGRSRLLYARPYNCQGPICEPQREPRGALY